VKKLHLFCRSLDAVPEGAHSLELFFYSDRITMRRALHFRDKSGKLISVHIDGPELGLCRVKQAVSPQETETVMKENGVFIPFSSHRRKSGRLGFRRT
jgi:hypothetical protein